MSEILDTFSSTDELRGKDRTYENVKALALRVGRYSIFEATENDKNIMLFTRLKNDPEVETFTNPPGYPWIGVRLREKEGEGE